MSATPKKQIDEGLYLFRIGMLEKAWRTAKGDNYIRLTFEVRDNGEARLHHEPVMWAMSGKMFTDTRGLMFSCHDQSRMPSKSEQVPYQGFPDWTPERVEVQAEAWFLGQYVVGVLSYVPNFYKGETRLQPCITPVRWSRRPTWASNLIAMDIEKDEKRERDAQPQGKDPESFRDVDF